MVKQIIKWLGLVKPWGFRTNPSQVTPEERELILSLIEEEKEELREALLTNDREAILDAVVDLYWVASNIIPAAGITLEELERKILQVEQSNFSKLCKTSAEAYDTMVAYHKGEHPDKPGESIACDYGQMGDYWVMYRESDGKVMKSINYKEPNEF